MRGGGEGNFALAQQTVAEDDRRTPPRVDDDRRQIVEVLQLGRQRCLDGRRRLPPLAAVMDRNAHPARLIKLRCRTPHQQAGVLAPLHVAFVPRRPQAVFGVAGQADVSLVAQRVGDGRRVRPGFAVVAAHRDVVIALVVSVPADVHAAFGVGGDGGVPVVPLRRRDPLFLRPANPVETAGEDVRPSAAETLPDQPQPPPGIGGRNVVDVRPRGCAEAFDARPLVAVETPAVQVEIAFHLIRPDDPDARIARYLAVRVAVAAQARLVDVAAGTAQGKGFQPRAGLAAAGHDGVASLRVGDPGCPQSARSVGDQVGKIVLRRAVRQPFDRRGALDGGGAVEKMQYALLGNLAEAKRKIAVHGRNVDLGVGLRIDGDDQPRGVDVIGHGRGWLRLPGAVTEFPARRGFDLPSRALDAVGFSRPPTLQHGHCAAGNPDGAVPRARRGVGQSQPYAQTEILGLRPERQQNGRRGQEETDHVLRSLLQPISNTRGLSTRRPRTASATPRSRP